MKIKVKIFKHQSRNAYSTTAKFFAYGYLKGKRIEIDNTRSNLTETQQSYYDPPLSYNYRIIDKHVEVFNEDLNIELIGSFHFYCKLNYFQRLKLKKIFGDLWIQQSENFKWIVTAVFAGIGVFLAVSNFILNCNC